jgi:hypothetical protein
LGFFLFVYLPNLPRYFLLDQTSPPPLGKIEAGISLPEDAIQIVEIINTPTPDEESGEGWGSAGV